MSGVRYQVSGVRLGGGELNRIIVKSKYGCKYLTGRFVYVSPKINTLAQVPKSNGIFCVSSNKHTEKCESMFEECCAKLLCM